MKSCRATFGLPATADAAGLPEVVACVVAEPRAAVVVLVPVALVAALGATVGATVPATALAELAPRVGCATEAAAVVGLAALVVGCGVAVGVLPPQAASRTQSAPINPKDNRADEAVRG